jgi:hypothetical protein
VIAFETAVNRVHSFITAFAIIALGALGVASYRVAGDLRLWRQTVEQTDQLALTLSQQTIATTASVQ